MSRKWTVLGIGGKTTLHVAAVMHGDVTSQLAGSPEPMQWVNVVKAPHAEAATLLAISTYEDHRAGNLGDAQVRMEVVTASPAARALARWRRKRKRTT